MNTYKRELKHLRLIQQECTRHEYIKHQICNSENNILYITWSCRFCGLTLK